jgi:hypothetical protein
MKYDMSLFTISQHRYRILFILLCVITVGFFLKVSFFNGEPGTILRVATPNSRISKALVVSSQTKDNTSWLNEHLADWNIIRYVTDDQTARYTVPKNKGREAMVYLT